MDRTYVSSIRSFLNLCTGTKSLYARSVIKNSFGRQASVNFIPQKASQIKFKGVRITTAQNYIGNRGNKAQKDLELVF